jgi:hypothetical protein
VTAGAPPRGRTGDHALLLPHFQLGPDGLLDVEGKVHRLAPRLEAALRLCDGTRTLEEVAREARVPPRDLIREHEKGRLILWRSAPGEGPATSEGPPAHVIVSPHLDDAALSLGASLLAGPARSWLVLDVFSRGGWWRLDRWDGHLLQATRRQEEQTMARLSGARLLDCDLPEALLRGHDFNAVFSTDAGAEGPAGADREAAARIEAEVAGLAARWGGARWYLPLGAGDHRDHRICRDAALRALRGREGRIAFYEDQPYAANQGGQPDFGGAVPGLRLVPRLQEGTAEQMRWKLELLRVYWSQFTQHEIEQIARYARRIGGTAPAERVWRPASATPLP